MTAVDEGAKRRAKCSESFPLWGHNPSTQPSGPKAPSTFPSEPSEPGPLRGPLFLIHNLPVPKKDFFPSPGKGVIFISFIEAAVRQGFHHFSGEKGNPFFVDFRQGRGGRFTIIGTAVLAGVAAEDKRRSFDDFLFLFPEVFFFLGEVGFAAP